MGLLSRFFRKQVNPSIFSFLYGISPPEMKELDYLRAYKGWVYACVNAIAEEVATIDLHLMRKAKQGLEEVDNHLALNLLHDVNPFMSSGDLFLGTQAYLELNGNSFWYLPKGKIVTKPAEIWLLDPTRVKVVKSEQSFVGGYVYQNEKGQNVPLEVFEIIHFKRFNPLNRFRGMGTVQAAALSIDIDTYSAQWNKNFFYNAALPSGVLETEGTITEEQYQRIKARWEAQYKGVENAHKFAILEGGLKFKLTSLNQKEMDFLEQRRFSRDEILGIFRVPKTALLITEDVNRANAEATDYVFAKRVVKPRMKFVVDRLNEFYLPLFNEDQRQLFFTFTDPVPENIELELKRKETGIRAGFYTINEVRQEEGLPPVTNGDAIYQPVNLMPIGEVENQSKNLPVVVSIELKAVTKNEIVEKRVRFIASEIIKRRKEFHKILLSQKAQLLNRLKKRKSVSKDTGDNLVRFLFEDWDDWIGVLYDPIEDSLKTSLSYAGKEVVRRIDSEVSFDLLNPRTLDWLSTHALEHARSVTGSIKDEIAVRVMEGVEQGLSIDAIADNTSEFFDKQAEWRAVRIARTEIISGYSEGTLEGMRQTGIKTKKWSTAGDDRVDPDCEMNERDGAIDINATFSSGNLAPPVHPNCRCILQEVHD